MTTLRKWLESMDENFEDEDRPWVCEVCGCEWWPELEDGCPACQ